MDPCLPTKRHATRRGCNVFTQGDQGDGRIFRTSRGSKREKSGAPQAFGFFGEVNFAKDDKQKKERDVMRNYSRVRALQVQGLASILGT